MKFFRNVLIIQKSIYKKTRPNLLTEDFEGGPAKLSIGQGMIIEDPQVEEEDDSRTIEVRSSYDENGEYINSQQKEYYRQLMLNDEESDKMMLSPKSYQKNTPEVSGLHQAMKKQLSVDKQSRASDQKSQYHISEYNNSV